MRYLIIQEKIIAAISSKVYRSADATNVSFLFHAWLKKIQYSIGNFLKIKTQDCLYFLSAHSLILPLTVQHSYFLQIELTGGKRHQ